MISYDNIAKALYMRGLSCNINTIQIASNKNFVSIKFKSQQLMETFCSEGLLVKGFNIEFNPDKKKPPPQKHLMNTSFSNIWPVTPEHLLTEFSSVYADIEGTPPYVKKSHNGIEYSTGICVYQVTRLYQHIPRPLKNMFGRTVCCIYDEQPEEKAKRAKREREELRKYKSHHNTNISNLTNSDSDDKNYEGWVKANYRKRRQTPHRTKIIAQTIT